jgi:hypothetical protein
LEHVERADRAEIYQRLGLVLTYDSGKQKVLVEMDLNQHSSAARRLPVGVRGGVVPGAYGSRRSLRSWSFSH